MGKNFFHALTLPVCFTTEQNTVEASLFVKYKLVFPCVITITSVCHIIDSSLVQYDGHVRQ